MEVESINQEKVLMNLIEKLKNNDLLKDYTDKIIASSKNMLEILFTDNHKDDVLASKIGGTPYLPEGFNYPCTPTGDKHVFLAQFNLSDFDNLDCLPEKGILQFYIPHSFYGVAKDDSPFVFYHEDTTIQNQSGYKNIKHPVEAYYNFRIPKKCTQIDFKLNSMPVSGSDYRFYDFEIFDIDDENYSDLLDEYDELLSDISESRIAGYPNFMQDDPREYSSGEKHNILLLQLGKYQHFSDEKDATEYDAYFGDMGTISFLITENDLKLKNFTNVLLYADSV